MHAREHVERLVIASLSVQRPDDLPDDIVEVEFKLLVPDIERAIARILKDSRVPGFTDDDLVSFMLLKAHKLLRQRKYDFERSAYSFFYVAFKNLVRDMLRRTSSGKAAGMRWDLLDLFEMVEFEESKGVPLSVRFPDAY